ncbi:MAG: DUF1289 domain-containing protein, partial [Gammaproteobacteria bacterium]
MNGSIESPCVDICQLRKGDDICRGCFRTLIEIGAWSSMSAERRREIMDVLPSR